jgi:hypothetical protein
VKNKDPGEETMQAVFTKKEPPQYLLEMRKEIDDKTFG